MSRVSYRLRPPPFYSRALIAMEQAIVDAVSNASAAILRDASLEETFVRSISSMFANIGAINDVSSIVESISESAFSTLSKNLLLSLALPNGESTKGKQVLLTPEF